MNLLSTLHHNPEVSNREDKKPQIILDYNKCKGGVGTLDKVVSCYTCKRKTNRWPQVVFSNMLDISAYKRRHFLEKLGLQLSMPYIKHRKTLPRAQFSREITQKIRDVAEHDQDPSTSTKSKEKICEPTKTTTKRNRCQLCPRTDNKTPLVGITCKKFVCKQHSKTITLCNLCSN